MKLTSNKYLAKNKALTTNFLLLFSKKKRSLQLVTFGPQIRLKTTWVWGMWGMKD